ncbi:hypothetical protein C6A85_12085, partial [Mycobacterium sp. ITM-2017-0098]
GRAPQDPHHRVLVAQDDAGRLADSVGHPLQVIHNAHQRAAARLHAAGPCRRTSPRLGDRPGCLCPRRAVRARPASSRSVAP